MTRQEALDGTIIQCLLCRYARHGHCLKGVNIQASLVMARFIASRMYCLKGVNIQVSLPYKSMRRQDSVRSDTHSIFFFSFPQKSLFVSLLFYIFATDKDDSMDET